jgi:hypothetical protein
MPIKGRFASLLLASCAAAMVVATAVPTSGQAPKKESFTGFAINMNSGPNTGTVDFTIERWSTDQERAQLGAILKEFKDPYQANSRLLQALQKMPKTGFIKTQRTLAWDLRYARQTPLPDGGRRIVLATDRPMGFGEVARGARTTEYPFTIVEMRLDKSDKGEGKILVGTRLLLDGNDLVLENYGTQPVQFNRIQRLD